jgi:AraC-like DNA-binding protein
VVTIMLPRAVQRALDLIEADPGRPLGLADLARAAGVAPRTLQKQFRAALGKSPGAAIRHARLARARQELLRGNKVTDAALSCQFSHMGRFAADYRARYGETPSATLKRQRPFAPPAPKFFAASLDRPTLAVSPRILSVPESFSRARESDCEMRVSPDTQYCASLLASAC